MPGHPSSISRLDFPMKEEEAQKSYKLFYGVFGAPYTSLEESISENITQRKRMPHDLVTGFNVANSVRLCLGGTRRRRSNACFWGQCGRETAGRDRDFREEDSWKVKEEGNLQYGRRGLFWSPTALGHMEFCDSSSVKRGGLIDNRCCNILGNLRIMPGNGWRTTADGWIIVIGLSTVAYRREHMDIKLNSMFNVSLSHIYREGRRSEWFKLYRERRSTNICLWRKHFAHWVLWNVLVIHQYHLLVRRQENRN